LGTIRGKFLQGYLKLRYLLLLAVAVEETQGATTLLLAAVAVQAVSFIMRATL